LRSCEAKRKLRLMRHALFAVALAFGGGACASSTAANDHGDASTRDGNGLPILGGHGGWTGPCTGLECQIHACNAAPTDISGTIYDPAGRNPLYGVVAYIPNATPEPFTQGASCGTCDSLFTGTPIATAISDADGKFTLTNVPDGVDVPIVVQVGKWRKRTLIPQVKRCASNALPDKSLRLPRNHTEGDIPMIAISTGGSDTLECLLSRVGVDASEYSPGATGPGHIQIYLGDSLGVVPNTSPPGPMSAAALWDSTADLMRYDLLLLSCEGQETVSMNQPALLAYTAAGGRVFASHFHYAWFNTGPFALGDLATWTRGINDIGNIVADVQGQLPDRSAFPKGAAMQKWLGTVGALQDGQLPIEEAKHNANVTSLNPLSTPWLLAGLSSKAPHAAQYFSFDTPLGAAPAAVCGRVVYSDLHVGAASNDNPNLPVPKDCTPGPLSPQESALEFMLFDLSSCVIPLSQPPAPPLPTK
jgi:hypothetical protein